MQIDHYISKKLRERRLKLGLTLEAVAKKLGISYQLMQKYEQSQVSISVSMLYQLAGLYGVEPQYFFEGFEPPISSKEFCILLIEDNPADARLIREIIKEAKVKTYVFNAVNNEQALKFLNESVLNEDLSRPDLIFMSLDSLNWDGIATLKNIKSNTSSRDIPVIVFVNVLNLHTLRLAYLNQAAGYLCKDNKEIFKRHIIDLINYWFSVVTIPSHVHTKEIQEG